LEDTQHFFELFTQPNSSSHDKRGVASARKNQVNLEETTLYHCMVRCVRGAFLCGEDSQSGKNFEHRKEWIRDRLRWLAGIFAIEVCAYAILSNHLHTILNVDLEKARGWSSDEVVDRYKVLHKCGAEQWANAKTEAARARLVSLWRSRLSSLSWFMGNLNEYIARKANKEDRKGGRFWEGRFKSQALLDDVGLLSCMAYVDLNPVRAGMADTLEGSDFTSVQERLFEVAKSLNAKRKSSQSAENKPYNVAPETLVPFLDQTGGDDKRFAIPLTFADYVAFVEWTGRQFREGKRGKLEGPPPRLFQELGIEAKTLLDAMHDGQLFKATALGRAERLDSFAEKQKRKFIRGKSLARRLMASA
jgi:REP element-mobilizing transposase RayT